MQSYISSLKLFNYRNFNNFTLELSPNPVVIIGQNGAGKTNILESISLINPGRGLRGTSSDLILANNIVPKPLFWTTKFIYSNNDIKSLIENKFTIENGKSKILYNDKIIRAKEIADIIKIAWVTPQMHHVFTAPASDRRKFFDRIVYSFFPDHAGNISRYEHYQKERIYLLKSNNIDEGWLSLLESKMSQYANLVIDHRVNAINLINNLQDKLDGKFPRIKLCLSGEIDELYSSNSADFVGNLEIKLKNNRQIDSLTKRTHFGAHKTDLTAFHLGKNLDAKLCSMGEQKAVLVGIILSQLNILQENFDISPIILLDEVFAHLDNKRSKYLSDYLIGSNVQAWITDTDMSKMTDLKSNSNLYNLDKI